MIAALKKVLSAPRLRDRIFTQGGEPARGKVGVTMADGSPVTVEHIVRTWGVSREYAEAFVKRHTP